MAKDHLLFDKTEIICFAMFGNRAELINLQYSSIQSILIDKVEEKKLFGAKQTERICIINTKTPKPLEYFQSKEKNRWDSYKEQMIKFAKDNRIPITVSI